MDQETIDFTIRDPLSYIVLEVERQFLYVHKEILAIWSPVFKSMFMGHFKEKNDDVVKSKSFSELQKDPHFKYLEQENLINILQLRVLNLEGLVEQDRKAYSERDSKMFGVINELASGYGHFCTECKSRKGVTLVCSCRSRH
ncbi:hypothetical protein HELRODRAFT_180327 [Helobdella robusta]|uniref:BTB domain-containing protein n=1 Tax=Helobdella robusta TaxID=6412 RepID=T1FFR3_HELRO|nr:hypothetical protein HELRODRAFT_180327 [Helobdella robusta]ESN93920.1 hypothetical protein HELRODRAFT_180327 [Helobdella robusta]